MDSQIFWKDQLTGSRIAIFLLLLGVIAYTSRLFRSIFSSPSRIIPGPFLARFTRLWELRQIIGGKSHETFVKMHEEHGPVVRIAPNVYSFNSLDDQKRIYDIKGGFEKTAYYDAFADPTIPNLFSMRNEGEHSQRRRNLGGLYSMSTMTTYEPAVDRMNEILMRNLIEFVKCKKAIQVPQLMQYYAFDVIGEITLNKAFGFMEAEHDVDDLIKTMHEASIYQSTVGIIPETHPFLHRTGPWIGFKNEGIELNNHSIAAFDQHRQSLLENKENPCADPFITKLLKLQAAGKLDMIEMLDSVSGNIAAGSDTTAISVSALLYYIYRTPRVLQALREEIDAMEKEGELSDPVTWKESQNMPYLKATVQETLRIHSAIGYMLPSTVPSGGIELAGRYLSKTTVGVCAWALHRNKAVYGPDVEEFNHERFLGSKNDIAASFDFGGGTRTCIGNNISLLEMFKVVPQIVRKFDLEFVDGKEWELSTNWFVWPKYHCYFKESKRGIQELTRDVGEIMKLCWFSSH